MHTLSVIVAQNNPSIAHDIVSRLRTRVHNVSFVHSRAELRAEMTKRRADAVILDLELVGPKELRQFCEEFRGITIVATHRSPDDKMWKAALEMGAVDCCHCADVEGILRAITQNARFAHAHAA